MSNLLQGLNLGLSKRFAFSPLKQDGGFTVIEMVVSIAILAVLTLGAFGGYPSFRRSISLRRTAQEVAVAVRQAQTYALGVKGSTPPAGAPFVTGEQFSGYGIYFKLSDPKKFIIFADYDSDLDGPALSDKTYTDTWEDIEKFTIETDSAIQGIGGCEKANNCPNESDFVNLKFASALYERPKPVVTLSGMSTSDIPKTNLRFIRIRIVSTGATKDVIIRDSGQIEVK